MSASLVLLAPSPARKRRLDHLSWEEKLQRKKLKNRVAAQTSRDRKKAKMDEMEDRLHSLEKVNAKLIDEMRSLRELNERLLSENGSLKSKVVSENIVVKSEPSGSAVSHPLPKEGSSLTTVRTEPALALCQLAMVFLLSKISSHKLTQMNTSTALNSLPTIYLEKLMQKLKTEIQLNPKMLIKSKAIHEKWWGPHQSTWNPVEVKI